MQCGPTSLKSSCINLLTLKCIDEYIHIFIGNSEEGFNTNTILITRRLVFIKKYVPVIIIRLMKNYRLVLLYLNKSLFN